MARPRRRARRPGSSGRRRRRRPGPRSAPSRTTRSWRSRRLAGSIGFASWWGKVPSSSKYIGTSSTSPSGSRPKTAGAVWPAMPLPASTTTLSAAVAGHRHERDQVLGVGLEQVERAHRAGVRDRGSGGEHEVADLVEPGLQPERHGVGPAQLDAVVLGRVVARREHRAGHAEVAGGEVEHVGRGQPDHHDVGAGLGGAGRERRGQPGRARPHVVADDDGGGAGHLGVRPPGRAGQRLVDLLRRQPPDVVRLEDGAHGLAIWHGREPRTCVLSLDLWMGGVASGTTRM